MLSAPTLMDPSAVVVKRDTMEMDGVVSKLVSTHRIFFPLIYLSHTQFFSDVCNPGTTGCKCLPSLSNDNPFQCLCDPGYLFNLDEDGVSCHG